MKDKKGKTIAGWNKEEREHVKILTRRFEFLNREIRAHSYLFGTPKPFHEEEREALRWIFQILQEHQSILERENINESNP